MAQVDFYAKLMCSFPDSEKLHALREAAGISDDSAVAAVARLLCRIRRHRRYGNLDGVSDLTIGEWAKNPKVTLKALIAAGWVDAGTEATKPHWHGWSELYGTDPNEAEAVRNAERQRAHRERNKKVTGPVTKSNGSGNDAVTPSDGDSNRPGYQEEEEKENNIIVGSTPTAPQTPEALLSAWNALATRLGLPTAKLTTKRTPSAKARIAEGLLERWSEFAAALGASSFHLGQNDRKWRANFDWLCRPDKWTALLENAPVTGGQLGGGIFGATHDEIARAALLDVFGPGQQDAKYRDTPCRLSVSDHGIALAMYSDNTSSLLNDDIVAAITPLHDTPPALAEAARRLLRERVVTLSEAS